MYYHISFKTPESLTDKVFDSVRGLLNEKVKQPLIIHCSSANRVGAVWLAHRVLDGGISYDKALTEAKTVGLKLSAYEDKAKAYIAGAQVHSKSTAISTGKSGQGVVVHLSHLCALFCLGLFEVANVDRQQPGRIVLRPATVPRSGLLNDLVRTECVSFVKRNGLGKVLFKSNLGNL